MTRTPVAWAAWLLCGLIVFAGFVHGDFMAALEADDDPPADDQLRADIARWLDELGSDEYEIRRAAREHLEQHGPRAPDLLEARLEDPDAEVRRTVKRLLDSTTPRQPVAQAGNVAGLGRISVPAGTKDVSELLAAFGHFELPEGHVGSVDLDGDLDGSYFQVLETVLGLAGLEMPQPFDPAGFGTLKERKADPGRRGAPWAAVGPLRVTATEVSATRPLIGSAQPRYRVALEVRWAPTVQVVQLDTPRVVRAVDPAGRAFVSTAGARITSYGVSYMQTARALEVGVQAGGDEFEEMLATLALKLRVRVRHGLRVVRFEDLDSGARCLDADGNAVDPGTAGSVELKSFEKEESGHRPQWVVELIATLPDELQRSTAYIVVTWSDGRRQRLHVMGGRSQSADGTLSLTARAYPQGDSEPVSVDVQWFERETDGEVDVSLADVPLR